MNALDVFLIIVLAAVFVLAIIKIHKDRKNGKGCLSCGGSCAGCTLSESCGGHGSHKPDGFTKTACVHKEGGSS